jgi:putative ABC transport system ATP-binding protein
MSLRAEGLCCRIGGRVLWQRLSFRLRPGDRLALVAPSGSGKTLLLRRLALLDPLQGGSLRLHGRPPQAWGPPAWRSRVLYLSQRPVTHAGTVAQNLQSVWSWAAHRRRGGWRPGRIARWLAALGRDGGFLERDADRLSGGELQLLALLRALQLDPDVLLLDEPCASLDAATSRALETLLLAWQAGGERACLLTSHDADQIARLATGRLPLTP